MENDIYFQIGLVVLIGLAAKNAILIVEFAQQGCCEGMSAIDAALQAARLRFRPIVMTSLAFVLGVLPLAIATGAGAARAPLDGHRRGRRHARRDLHRRGLRAALLRLDVARPQAGRGRRAAARGRRLERPAGRDPRRRDDDDQQDARERRSAR